MKIFKGKVAAITGAGSGIGQQLALLLAQAGCEVALSDVNQKGLEATLELLKETGVKTSSHIVNVASNEEVLQWADKVVAEHGKVNLIFNNAGVALSSTVEGASMADYEWLMGINFWGVVYGTKAFLPYLKQSGEGHVINISSLFGLMSQPTQSAYNASKFAVRGFTESLRQELDIMNCGVSATCVHPGGIKTNIAKDARMEDNVKSLGMKSSALSKQADFALRKPPKEAAQDILNAVLHDKRRVLVGMDAKIIDLLQRVLPTGYQSILVAGSKLMK